MNLHILFTHVDLDGAGCDIIFQLYCLALGTQYRVFSLGNNEIDDVVMEVIDDPEIKYGSEIKFYFADISPSWLVLEEMVARNLNIHLYDHHLTSEWCMELLRNRGKVDLSGKESGTSLLYQHLVSECGFVGRDALSSEIIVKFVDTVRAWDVWEWVQTNNLISKYLVNLFFILGYERFVRLYLDRFLTEGSSNQPLILPEHQYFIDARLESQQENIDLMTPNKVISQKIFGYEAAVIFTGVGFPFSDGSYQFLRRHPQFDIMVNINLARKTISYRTIKEGIDLGTLAATVGGGGHLKASGSPISDDQQSSILEVLMKDLKYE